MALALFLVYNTSFLITADVNGDIGLLVAASGAYGGAGNQDGAVLNALVLTSVAAIPAPSSWAARAGLGAPALAAGRPQKNPDAAAEIISATPAAGRSQFL